MHRKSSTRIRRLLASIIALAGVLSAACSTTGKLPAGLSSPDHGVVCDGARGACFDRFGPSIGLTEIYLGPAAAQALTGVLRDTPSARGPGTEFSPGDNVACRRVTGPCRAGALVHEALTAALFSSRPEPSRGVDASALIGVDWQWNVSRYSNDTQARPGDPGRYRLRLEPDGSLRAQLDCNQAGGRYRIDGSLIAIEVTYSTRAACEPGSLDQAFQRDLGAAAIYFMRRGRLYLDLKHDTGTMEFGRR